MIKCFILGKRDHIWMKDAESCNPAIFNKLDSLRVGDSKFFSVIAVFDGLRYVASFNDEEDGKAVYNDLLRAAVADNIEDAFCELAFVPYTQFDSVRQRFELASSNIAAVEDIDAIKDVNNIENRKLHRDFWNSISEAN